MCLTHHVRGARPIVRTVKAHFDRIARTADARVTNLLVAELGTEIRRRTFGLLLNGRVHINLQEEMHTAPKVKPQVHRQRIDLQKPSRGVGNQVRRHDVRGIRTVRIKRLFNRFTGLKLFFGLRRVKTHANRVLLRPLFKEDAVGL